MSKPISKTDEAINGIYEKLIADYSADEVAQILIEVRARIANYYDERANQMQVDANAIAFCASTIRTGINDPAPKESCSSYDFPPFVGRSSV